MFEVKLASSPVMSSVGDESGNPSNRRKNAIQWDDCLCQFDCWPVGHLWDVRDIVAQVMQHIAKTRPAS